jgi:hypothetical protein
MWYSFAVNSTTTVFTLVLISASSLLVGCARQLYQPDRATRAYPFDLHTTQTVDMQVFRDHENLEIVNTTAMTYTDVDVWINQRYVQRVEAIPAGRSVTLSLWGFADQWGGVFNAGGIWRTYEPTPVRLVELQTQPDQPTMGLIAIRAEDPPSATATPDR